MAGIPYNDRYRLSLLAKVIMVLLVWGTFPDISGAAETAVEDVKIKILAVNPSPTNVLNTSINHVLPPEIMPEDIVDAAGMKIEFDKDSKAYALSQPVELKPRETRTIEVHVKNVWVVSEEVLSEMRSHIQKSVEAMQGTKYEESSRLLYDKVSERLSLIETEQSKAIGVRQRIELYRAHMKQLEGVYREISSLQALRELAGETGQLRTVKLVIAAENPTSQSIEMKVRAIMPKDIKTEDILDKLDFHLLYNEHEGRFILEKADKFGPNEKKNYEIILRDIWFVSKEEMEYLAKQTEKLLKHFEQSDYEAFAIGASEYIQASLASIARLQEEVGEESSIEERIRAFVLNSERLDLVKKKIKELQDLLLEVPMKKQLSEFDKIREAVKELSKVVDVLRLGFTPDLSTTWWIILGIIAFLFILSAMFYMTWLVKLQDSQWGKRKGKSSKSRPSATPVEVEPKPPQENQPAAA